MVLYSSRLAASVRRSFLSWRYALIVPRHRLYCMVRRVAAAASRGKIGSWCIVQNFRDSFAISSKVRPAPTTQVSRGVDGECELDHHKLWR